MRTRAPLRLVALSDTHFMHRRVRVPDGDLLLFAGDFAARGALHELHDFDDWLGTLPHRHKVVIAGNHDFCWERENAASRRALTNATYLEDSAVVIEGWKVYGSPWQPRFFDWAFNLDRGAPIREKWLLIPADTDILVTHGPPLGHGDVTVRGDSTGCADLLDAVQRIAPQCHVFGHIHEGAGISADGQTTFVNASICDAGYRPVFRPAVLDLDAPPYPPTTRSSWPT